MKIFPKFYYTMPLIISLQIFSQILIHTLTFPELCRLNYIFYLMGSVFEVDTRDLELSATCAIWR